MTQWTWINSSLRAAKNSGMVTLSLTLEQLHSPLRLYGGIKIYVSCIPLS